MSRDFCFNIPNRPTAGPGPRRIFIRNSVIIGTSPAGTNCWGSPSSWTQKISKKGHLVQDTCFSLKGQDKISTHFFFENRNGVFLFWFLGWFKLVVCFHRTLIGYLVLEQWASPLECRVSTFFFLEEIQSGRRSFSQVSRLFEWLLMTSNAHN